MAINTSDPLLAKQWHLSKINLGGIFAEYRGAGIKVGIYDTGVQTTHEDLAANYDASTSITVNGVQATATGTSHGTNVAGVIGAAANDGIGGLGVASEARLTSVNIFSGSASGSGFIPAVQQMSAFDVVNNSWGMQSRYDDGVDSAFGKGLLSAIADVAATGRHGLGTIIVNATGNDWMKGNIDANSSEFNAARQTITVGAVTDQDTVASYVSRGASILVSAPSSGGTASIQTTDSILGYTGSFTGTSASTPIVSGVVALMLQANPHLGWRDVQDILALSAQRVGSAMDGVRTGGEAFGWTTNHAEKLNGGGLHFSNDYGFGLVDARAAVRMAEVWSNFSAAQTSANEKNATASLTAGQALVDGGTTTLTTALNAGLDVEHVDLTIKLTHGNVNELQIELVSPNGTVSQVLSAGSGATESVNGWTWSLGSEAFRGENSGGIWTVRITDTVTGQTGRLDTANLQVYGSAQSADNVYHFTDDYFASALAAPERAILNDANGGNDWIDASATRMGVKIDLNAGHMSTIAGGNLSISANSIVENAVGGEGADVLIGNAGDNIFIGGHGADMFVFLGKLFGHDQIRDFVKGQDKIAFDGAYSAATVQIVDTAAGNVIVADDNSSVLLKGVHDLDMSDIVFNIDLVGLAARAAIDV